MTTALGVVLPTMVILGKPRLQKWSVRRLRMFVLWWNLRIHEVSRSPSFTVLSLKWGLQQYLWGMGVYGAYLVLGAKDSPSSQFWEKMLQTSEFSFWQAF